LLSAIRTFDIRVETRIVQLQSIFDTLASAFRIISMAIPAGQLETWSHQGGTGISTNAYGSVRYALTRASSPLSGRNIEIFLQGSYANATNTHGDSDIDVVVLYEETFYKDMSALTPMQQQAHERSFGIATYDWSHLRNDVLAALRTHFGAPAVTPGNKAIKVTTGAGRMTADVVPAVQFRRYATFADRNNLTAHWGVHLFDAAGNGITNYPKYHIERGQDKNGANRTAGRYKSTVRVFKNFRSYMIDRGLLTREIAPSYFVECAVYNAPDRLFLNPYAESIPAILEFLWTTPFPELISQNGVVPLIGLGPTHWSKEDFTTFLTAARQAWTNF